MSYVDRLLANPLTSQIPWSSGFKLLPDLQKVVTMAEHTNSHRVREIRKNTTITLRLLKHLNRTKDMKYKKNLLLFERLWLAPKNSGLSMGVCCQSTFPCVFDLVPYIAAAQNMLLDKPLIIVERGRFHKEVRDIKRTLGYDRKTYKCDYCETDRRILLSNNILRWISLRIWTGLLNQHWEVLLKTALAFWPVPMNSLSQASGVKIAQFLHECLSKNVFEFRFSSFQHTRIGVWGPRTEYFFGTQDFNLIRPDIQEVTRTIKQISPYLSNDEHVNLWNRFDVANNYNHSGERYHG